METKKDVKETGYFFMNEKENVFFQIICGNNDVVFLGATLCTYLGNLVSFDNKNWYKNN